MPMFLSSLREHGPLKTLGLCFGLVYRQLKDYRFDMRYGTDTSGTIELEELTIPSCNVKEGIRYQPMPVVDFRKVVAGLDIDFARFTFVDFGSGKGRALLLASEFRFRRVIGVEFAPRLHLAATENGRIWARNKPGLPSIDTVCMDVTEFPIPDGPLMGFFYNPFVGSVVQRVLENVLASWREDPREILLLFIGCKSQTVRLFESMGFTGKQLQLRPGHFAYLFAIQEQTGTVRL